MSIKRASDTVRARSLSIASTMGSSHLSVSGFIGATRPMYPLLTIRKHAATMRIDAGGECTTTTA
jgi:hypothetical protein